ncbi:unnamed protein product [Rotaria sp. Silwood2]|nr:unnamed protein product [Rotaria sp. Silwood2]CAF2844820.1 unnamed protein product [Rotaria sp. Silwood2]CAF3015191.1 unnamed protein product [Rotaria sp. Silwood2]CAF3202160.1 unnamed protein product [Rotaria sp. Silwood2]CAF3926128.1 unnamed protein product [Rotaria sp. Silwood2]
MNRNYRDDDDIFHGFIPLWALVLFSIAIIFLIIFIAGLICHLIGCRRPKQDQTKNNIHSSILKQPLLVENNQLETTSIKSNKLTQKSKDALF